MQVIMYELTTCNPQPATLNLQLTTYNLQLSTYNLQPATCNLQLTTHNPLHLITKTRQPWFVTKYPAGFAGFTS